MALSGNEATLLDSRAALARIARTPSREGLLDTPARVARSYRELFAGYEVDPRHYLERTFQEVRRL